MIAFIVTAHTPRGTVTYDAIAAHSFDVHSAAVDLFGVCAISVKVKRHD
jgi:hypothetical protein